MAYAGFIHAWRPTWAEAMQLAQEQAPLWGMRLKVRRFATSWVVVSSDR